MQYLEQLHNRYHGYVKHIIGRRVRLEADIDEIAQDTWLSVWRELSRGRTEINLSCIRTIATRRAQDFLRTRPGAGRNPRKYEPPLSSIGEIDDLPPEFGREDERMSDDTLLSKEELQKAIEAISNMSPEIQLAIRAVLNELPVKDYTRLTGWSYHKAYYEIKKARFQILLAAVR